ncbi:MAG: transporter substrate-binding domain-containing protein [Paucibacter sp.]|nr:transporter substrate-binding domain-containing protein [Roseateles sp.]
MNWNFNPYGLAGRRTRLLALALCFGSMTAAAAPVAMHFVTKQFPPYAYAGSNGQAAGPMVELLFAACAKAGMECSVSVLPGRRAYRMAEIGEADGIFPIVDSPDRRAEYDLSPDVVRGRYVLLGSSCDRGCVQQLDGTSRTVAAFGPSEASRTLQRMVAAMPGTMAQIEPDHQIVVRKLEAGRYGKNGLALVNDAVARWQMSDAGERRLHEVAMVRAFSYTYAFVRKPGSEGRGRQLSAAINEFCRSGKTAQIFKPYKLLASGCQPAGEPRFPSPSNPMRYAYEILR